MKNSKGTNQTPWLLVPLENMISALLVYLRHGHDVLNRGQKLWYYFILARIWWIGWESRLIEKWSKETHQKSWASLEQAHLTWSESFQNEACFLDLILFMCKYVGDLLVCIHVLSLFWADFVETGNGYLAPFDVQIWQYVVDNLYMKTIILFMKFLWKVPFTIISFYHHSYNNWFLQPGTCWCGSMAWCG